MEGLSEDLDVQNFLDSIDAGKLEGDGSNIKIEDLLSTDSIAGKKLCSRNFNSSTVDSSTLDFDVENLISKESLEILQSIEKTSNEVRDLLNSSVLTDGSPQKESTLSNV